MKAPVSAANSSAESFPPMTGKLLHTLILGSMPGQKSLLLQQYYAHPRNALWPILCAMVTGETPSFSVHQQLPYQQRCELIKTAGFGLWDVLSSCERPGSLDGNIVRSTEVPNAIHSLVARHRELRVIACNGGTAYTLFKRHVEPLMETRGPRVVRLPSTSPAMASLTLTKKFEQWSEALAP